MSSFFFVSIEITGHPQFWTARGLIDVRLRVAIRMRRSLSASYDCPSDCTSAVQFLRHGRVADGVPFGREFPARLRVLLQRPPRSEHPRFVGSINPSRSPGVPVGPSPLASSSRSSDRPIKALAAADPSSRVDARARHIRPSRTLVTPPCPIACACAAHHSRLVRSSR